VDLPTLGRPTTTMYPALKVDFSLVLIAGFAFRRSEKKRSRHLALVKDQER